jgi:hypothetical protein
MVLLPGRLSVNVALLNYAKWIREVFGPLFGVLIVLLLLANCQPDAQNVVNKLCKQDASLTVEDCFGTNDNTKYQVTDLSQDWRLWVFQYCTQWGYLTVRPPIHPPFL